MDADGLLVGYLVAQYPIEELARFFASVRDPSPGNLWVADQNGRLAVVANGAGKGSSRVAQATLMGVALLCEAGAGGEPQVWESAQAADVSLRRIATLIDNVLDVMKLEDGQLPLRKRPTNLRALADAKLAEHAPLLESTMLQGRLQGAGEVWAEVDPTPVGRVLGNLLANAVKHTPAGGEIAVRLDLDPERHVAILQVRDTGEGIPAHELPRLFHKYGRAASQCRGTRRDTGLGLLFSRLVAEAHGGRIHVESEVGRGSRFVVELPLLTAP